MNAEYINAMSDEVFAEQILIPELVEAGLVADASGHDASWWNLLAGIVRPRTKMLGQAAGVCGMVFQTADTLSYDEKSVSKGLAKEGMLAVLEAAEQALLDIDGEWAADAIDAALEPLPEKLDVKKRLVFQAVRVAVCGNMVSPPLGETMQLVGREDCLARIERAKGMAL